MLGVTLLAVSCLHEEDRNRPSSLQTLVSPTPQSEGRRPSPLPNPTVNSPIRSVDFSAVSYPNLPDYSHSSGYKKKRITLKPGEGAPSHINYGDVTDDGAEEAIVVLPIENRGSAIPYYVYIFTMHQGKPKLIWDFETGDRADGGLRQVYAQDGDLIIELYGRGKIIGTDVLDDDGTREEQPYPYSITRSRFVWVGEKFKQKNESEIFSDSKSYGSPIMPPYTGVVRQ
jgi:hypothetical protein